VKIFGGGFGVIVPAVIERLAKAGGRILAPEDGQRLGLAGMINQLIQAADTDLTECPPAADAVLAGERQALDGDRRVGEVVADR
jgi:isobutyryl-CoA mutase